MSKEDVLTLKAVTLYILKNMKEGLGRSIYYVVKTAFLAQQKHLAKYLCPIYEDKIVALRFGPVPSTLYDALKIARGDKNVHHYHTNDNLHLLYDAIDFNDEFFYALEDPDMDLLSKSAIECLNETIKEVSTKTFEQIVASTHGKEWERAYTTTDKAMNYVAIAQEGGADAESVVYIKENIEIKNFLK